MAPKNKNNNVMQDPDARLARMFLEEYLRTKGHTLDSLFRLPQPEAKQIMIEASTYASVKLAEISDKAELVHQLHGASGKG